MHVCFNSESRILYLLGLGLLLLGLGLVVGLGVVLGLGLDTYKKIFMQFVPAA